MFVAVASIRLQKECPNDALPFFWFDFQQSAICEVIPCKRPNQNSLIGTLRSMIIMIFSSGGALDAHDTQPPLSNKSAAAFAWGRREGSVEENGYPAVRRVTCDV